MPARTNTDTQETAKADVQKQVGLYVKAYFEADIDRHKRRWQLVLHFKEAMHLHGYSAKVVLEMYKQEILKVKKVVYRSEDKEFKSNMTVAYQTRMVALSLSNEQIIGYMQRGTSFTYVYNQLTDKKLNEINKKHRKDGVALDVTVKEDVSKKALDKLAGDGVVNAKEYADATVRLTKKKDNEDKEPRSTTYAAPDIDVEWAKTTRSIIKNDPRKFAKLIITCVERKQLPEDWEGPAQRLVSNIIPIES